MLFLLADCSQKPDISSNHTLSNAEKQLNTNKNIETTASSYDGKSTIKFRLMVKGNPSKAEATQLFNDVLEAVKVTSHHKDIWNYYNGQFDIKNYTNGVIFTASKNAKKSIVITKK
jgi:hypothetical protein